MKHYFTNNENLESRPEEFIFKYRDKDIVFQSDIGVFSKKMVDYGSQVLLKAIDVSTDQKTLLDVGCGYGTFGISLKKIFPFLDVDMVDVNSRALNLAKINAKRNEVEVNIFYSDCLDDVNSKHDLIVTNPPIRAGKVVVNKIMEGAYSNLTKNGVLWVVIQKKQGAPSLKGKLLDLFGNCETVIKDKGYYIFKAIKN